MSMRISSIRQVGGVNSIDNFARSLQRAAGFYDIGPARRGSFVLSDNGTGEDQETGSSYSRTVYVVTETTN